MDTPTVVEIRSWAPPAFDFSKYGFPTGVDPDPLATRVEWAVGQLYAITGRTLASITSTEEVSIAQKVLAAFTITEVVGGGQAAIAVLEAPWLKSFTAGSYSETRFSPAEIAGGTSKAPPYPPALWALLWALMDEDKRAEWLEMLSGRTRPAASFTGVEWDGFVDVGPSIHGQGIESDF